MDAVTRQRRDYWLGLYGTPKSRELCHRLIAEWEANGRRLPKFIAAAPINTSESETTVEEVSAAYWQWVEGYHGYDEAKAIRLSLRLLPHTFGSTAAARFGPKNLRLVRQAMLSDHIEGVKKSRVWSRPFINRQVQRIVALFKWAAAEEMIPVSVYQQLKTLEPLRRGKTTAPEPPPVGPVADALIDPVRDHVSPQVWALIQLQRLTGARSGELFKLRPVDLRIDEKTGIWTYSPAEHKTAHRGHARTIYFGPRAQNVIQPFLADRPVDRFLFSPAEAENQRREKVHAARKTPPSCGNRPGTNCVNLPSRMPGDHYTTDSYRRAIARACHTAFPSPAHLMRLKVKGKKGTRLETKLEWKTRLGPNCWDELRQWQRQHNWHPHQFASNRRHPHPAPVRHGSGADRVGPQQRPGHRSRLC